MIVHMTPAAKSMLSLIQGNQRPVTGWITGTFLGHAWLVNGLVSRNSLEAPSHEEIAAGVAAWGEYLIGEFFAFMQVSNAAATRGGLVLLVKTAGTEAAEGGGSTPLPFTRIIDNRREDE